MSESHKLAIKVLRLGRPQLKTGNFDKPSLYTDELVLPKTIGPCFAGEEFRCLLSINVEEPAENVELTAELHHGDEKFELIHETGLNLYPSESLIRKLEHVPSAAGPRVLVVQAKYIDGEHIRTLHKTFSFEVAPVLNLRVRIGTVKIGGPVCAKATDAVEVQVENCTESIVTLTNYDFKHDKHKFIYNIVEPVTLRPKEVFSFAAGMNAPSSATVVGTAIIDWMRDPLGYHGSTSILIKR